MSHELATTNGRTALAYFGEVPWHGLGTRLDRPATAEEAIAAAGLDYEVQLTALTTGDGIPVSQRKAVVRNDTDDVIGVVGNNYVPIQNRQCFGFLDAVVSEGRLTYHTAGALGRGERVWMLAKLPSYIRVKNGDDLVDKFLLLSNTHDGSSALRVFFTPIRVVCQNTLRQAESRGRGQGIAIMHRGDLQAKIREAQRVLGLAERFYDDAASKIDVLARSYLSAEQLESFFSALYPDSPDSTNRRAANVRHRLTTLFENGIGQDQPDIRHTAWAAYNAVTEYVDHHRPTRAKTVEQRASQRLESAWFGSGAALKAKAWNLALAMTN